MDTVNKTSRINCRTTQRQQEILRRAAQVRETTLTDFVLESAIARAEEILADQNWFFATETEYAKFEELLNSPLETTEKFQKLFARKSPFGKKFEFDE